MFTNFKIKFCGNNPTKETINLSQRLMNLLENKSPSDSFLNLLVTIGDDEAVGSFSINSTIRKFEAHGRGANPKALLTGLYDDLFAQIIEWKQAR